MSRMRDFTDGKTIEEGSETHPMIKKNIKLVLAAAISAVALSASLQAGPDVRGDFERPDLDAIKEKIAAHREAIKQRLEERGLDLEALKAKREERRAQEGSATDGATLSLQSAARSSFHQQACLRLG